MAKPKNPWDEVLGTNTASGSSKTTSKSTSKVSKPSPKSASNWDAVLAESSSNSGSSGGGRSIWDIVKGAPGSIASPVFHAGGKITGPVLHGIGSALSLPASVVDSALNAGVINPLLKSGVGKGAVDLLNKIPEFDVNPKQMLNAAGIHTPLPDQSIIGYRHSKAAPNSLGFKEGINQRITMQDILAQDPVVKDQLENGNLLQKLGITGLSLALDWKIDPLSKTQIKINKPAAALEKDAEVIKKGMAMKNAVKGQILSNLESTAAAKTMTFSKVKFIRDHYRSIGVKESALMDTVLGGKTAKEQATLTALLKKTPAVAGTTITSSRFSKLESELGSVLDRAAFTQASGKIAGEMAVIKAETTARSGNISFRLAGLPEIKAEKLYNGLSKAWAPVGDGDTFMALRKAFNPSAQFIKNASGKLKGTGYLENELQPAVDAALSAEMQYAKRAAENAGMRKANEVNFAFDEKLKSLGRFTDREQATIFRNIESGIPLPDPRMESARQIIIAQNRENLIVAQATGIGPVKDLGERYVKHVYKNTDSKTEELRLIKEARRTGLTKTGDLPLGSSVETAYNAGLKPILDPFEATRAATKSLHSELIQKSFYDEAAAKFGFIPKDANEVKVLQEAGFKPVVPGTKAAFHPSLIPNTGVPTDTLWLHPSTHEALKLTHAMFTSEKSATGVVKHIEYILRDNPIMRGWRMGVTSVNPSHHVNNAVGDAIINFFDGVKLKMYPKGAQLLKAEADNTLGSVAFHANGVPVPGTQVFHWYDTKGARSGFFASEMSDTVIGKTTKRIQEFSEKREDYTRLPHFLNALDEEATAAKLTVRSTKEEWDKAAELASKRVIRYNHDYGDVTVLEKHIKSYLPFYGWLRKNLPLQIEALFMHPGRLAAIARTQAVVQKSLGFTTDDIAEIMPEIPDWLKLMSPTLYRESNANGDAELISFGMPQNDLYRLLADPGKLVQNSLSPVIKTVQEYGTGRSNLTGAPINKNPLKYIPSQVPIGRMGVNALEGDTSIMKLMSRWLTGVDVKAVDSKMRESARRGN